MSTAFRFQMSDVSDVRLPRFWILDFQGFRFQFALVSDFRLYRFQISEVMCCAGGGLGLHAESAGCYSSSTPGRLSTLHGQSRSSTPATPTAGPASSQDALAGACRPLPGGPPRSCLPMPQQQHQQQQQHRLPWQQETRTDLRACCCSQIADFRLLTSDFRFQIALQIRDTRFPRAPHER